MEIRGNRLEPFHLNKIRKEIENEYTEKWRDNKSKKKKIKDYWKRKLYIIMKINLRNKGIRELKRSKKGISKNIKFQSWKLLD